MRQPQSEIFISFSSCDVIWNFSADFVHNFGMVRKIALFFYTWNVILAPLAVIFPVKNEYKIDKYVFLQLKE